jgi:hypothetical protein
MLVAQLQSGASVDDLVAGYSHAALSRAQVYAALAYYYDHAAEVEALIQTNDQMFESGKREVEAIRAALAAGEDLIPAAEAAAMLGLSPESNQVAHLCRGGKLDGRKVANRWFVRLSSVEEYAHSSRKPGPKPSS